MSFWILLLYIFKSFCIVQEQYGLKIMRWDKKEATISCILVNLVPRVLSTYNLPVVYGRNKGNVAKRWGEEMYFDYLIRLLIAASKLSGKKVNPFQTFICSKASFFFLQHWREQVSHSDIQDPY